MSTGTVGASIVSQSITTSGRPIQIIATGDANPSNAAWCQLQLYRDGTPIGKKLQAESSKGNENIPYCLNFIDNPTAGTYTYSVRFVTGSASFQFGEADGNQITLLELGAWSAGTMPVSKGGTGNSSYTTGSVIFSDGTNLAQNNSCLFWDNSNGRLGIGTSNPTSKLNIAGGGIRIASGFGNSTNRPSLNNSNIGNYEIRGVGSISGSTQNDLADDGFLRLSAGGGTNAIQQSSIDLSGYSATVPDMNSNIVMRTAGTERLRLDNSGNVNVTGKLNVTDPSGNVVKKVSGFVNAGDYVTLDNLKVRVAPSGNRSIQVATVSGTYTVFGSNLFSANGVGGTTIFENNKLTITTTPVYLNAGLHFVWGGYTDTWTIMDTNSFIAWRITCIIGNTNGAYANFISIERLL